MADPNHVPRGAKLELMEQDTNEDNAGTSIVAGPSSGEGPSSGAGPSSFDVPTLPRWSKRPKRECPFCCKSFTVIRRHVKTCKGKFFFYFIKIRTVNVV